MFASELAAEYDYIVVGSGAGGGVVAANLAKGGYHVLLLEAGGAEEPVEYKVPAFHALAAEHPDLSWNFFVQHYADPERQRRDKQNFVFDGKTRTAGVFYPRAGTLGGCTAHSAMIFVAPHDRDWDQIAEVTGDRSWSAKRMRTYFQRIERCEYLRRPWLNTARHGYDGWLPVSVADPALLLRDGDLSRLALAAVQTCYENGVWNAMSLGPRVLNWVRSFFDPADWQRIGLTSRVWDAAVSFLDPNDWSRVKRGSEGIALLPMMIRNGARFGTRELICETARQWPDTLTVKLHALATRVILDDERRATGVELIDAPHAYGADPLCTDRNQDAGPRTIVRAGREVILAGGAFNTPQLLMLSGIGPPAELSRHAIEVAVPLNGVGKNLQDRYEIGVVHRMKREFSLLERAELAPDDPEFAEWVNGHGLYATNGVLLAIIKRSSHAQVDPDLCLFAIPGYFSGYRPGYSTLGRLKDYFTWVILKAHTNNTAGDVRLRSARPLDTPLINFRYFEEGNDSRQEDLDAVASGVDFVRRIAARTASLFEEAVPGGHVRSRNDVAQFIKDSAWGHHACGTCKIGSDDDPDAVLDSRFRVRGTKGLRVVDASIFPKIPGFFILSAIFTAAEKASDSILADAGRKR